MATDNTKRIIYLALGPLLFALCTFALPESVFTTIQARMAIGTVAWMAFWWVTGPVGYAVTAFLPIALNALFQMTEMSTIIANYSNEIVLLLLGASIITVSWAETGLDKRIAIAFLGLVGSSLRSQLTFWFLLSTICSAVLPNAVVAATFMPIAVAMLKFAGEGDIENSRKGSKILLWIAYGAGLGGLASPLGGAMNLVVVDYIQQTTGEEFMYIDWVIRFLPIIIVLVIIMFIFMLRDVKKADSLGGSREFYLEQRKSLPKMSQDEIWVLGLFLAATILSFTRQFYSAYLPGLKPAYIFIIAAILCFLIMRKDTKEPIMVWKNIQGKIIWELIYIYAGGLAIGTLMSGSGAAENLGGLVSGAGLQAGLPLIFVIVVFTLLLSDVTSNTATASMALPIIIPIVQGLGADPIPYIYIAAIGINLSFMLPTSIRSIPVGYGMSPKYMLKEGWKITVVVIIAMTALSYLLMTYWPLFATV